MLKPNLNNLTIPDSILKHVLKYYSFFDNFFWIQQMPKNMAKTFHQAPKFLLLQWALVSSAPFHESVGTEMIAQS